ncbi:MAG: MCE family protein [Acidobacteria bacterium]|nr:MCE family protein [Acidobacteriota bacterium]
MSVELKVGAVVLVAIAVAAGFILNMNDTAGFFGSPTDVYRVEVRFNSVSGLGTDAIVRLAGVYIGRVENIGLTDDGRAVVTLRIGNGVILRADATASVASQGMLGEKYLEIAAGTSTSPVVTDGGSILPGAAVSIDQMVVVMNNIAADAQEMTNALSNVFGSEAGETRMQAILENTEALVRDLGQIARGNQAAIAASMTNIEGLTEALAESVPVMIENYRSLATEAASLVADNEDGVSATIAEVRDLIAGVDRSVLQLEEILQKINTGDGTAAQLINTSDTIDKVNDALDTIDDSLAAFDSFFNRVGSTQFSFSLRSEWYASDEATKNYFGFRVGLGASNTRGFIVELVNDNIGLPVVETFLTETLDSSGGVVGFDITRVTSRDDAFKLSALFASRFTNWQFRGGLMENEAGVGIDYFVGSDRLRFTLEGWDFGRNPDPHLKFRGQVDILDRLFVSVGADDLLSSDFRQFFIGAGFKFR